MKRIEAAKAGLLRYSTDKPCKLGHRAERYTSTGACVACLERHRKSVVQARHAHALGWPDINTQVPLDQVGLLRDVVHLLRLHGLRFDVLRSELASEVDRLLKFAGVPVRECLTLSGGRGAPRVVTPPQPVVDEGEPLPDWHSDIPDWARGQGQQGAQL